MANPKCVFEFKIKAKYTPSNVRKSPVNVKGKEDNVQIRNGGNNIVHQSGSQLQEFLHTEVSSGGIPTSKLSTIEMQYEEATIENVLQTLDGVNDFESTCTATEVKMKNVQTKEDIKYSMDDDVRNGFISNKIKKNKIPTPDVHMDIVVANNLLSVDLTNDEYTSDEVEITSVHSNTFLSSGDFNNTKTDENPTSIDDVTNDVEIIGNCTGNVTNEESAIETNEAVINDAETNIESGDDRMDNNIEHQDTGLIEPNEYGNRSSEVVQNTDSSRLTLLIQPTDTKNTGVLNNGYRNDEDQNYTGAPFGDTGTEDTDHSFYGGQVSRPDADGQPKDCSTYYTGLENSEQVSDENPFNKKNPRKQKPVSIVNENMQRNGDQSGMENVGFISDDDSIDTVIDISKLPRRIIRFSVYSAFKFPSEPKWQRKLGILIGISIDRYGVRLTIFVGSLMSCCGFLGAIFCPSTTTLLLSVAILPGLGLSGAQMGSIVVVSMACKRSVSAAMVLITAGGGCGSSILPYLFQFLIDKYGWRGAFFVIAGLSLQPMVFGFLMTAFMDQLTASRGHRVEKAVVTVKEKMKLMCRPEFITVALCALTAFSAANGFLFIIADYANNKNQNGVFFIFLMTIISTCGRLAFGFLNLLSFVNSRVLLTIGAILSGGSLICLGFVTQYATILGILVILGFNYGGQTGIYGVAILDLVGPQTFSLALGLCSTLNGAACAIGGGIYGLLFDMSGSYSQPCIIMGTVCCVFGILPILGLFYSKIKTNCK
ncbi:hypothetical protein SNE40_021850 [Patella caerulea]|uniref:Major facilitator superfamily (MFS) profile domain-containing protein n=1 Tax=Patella caerulea TaxID=87958 RepID=A0AAN8IYB7_PATCE